MKRKRANSSNSGQALIITSLIITMLLLSTAYHIIEMKRNTTRNETTTNYIFSAARLNTINTMVSALANVSNGGERDVLTANLDKLALALRDHYYDTQCDLLFVPLNSSLYQDGIRMSWESGGSGISSACVSFLMSLSEFSTSYNSGYEANVTTTLTINGVYTGGGSQKGVNVTCSIYNEEEPALANGITLFYQNETEGQWIMVSSLNGLNVIDYANGTYLMSFNVYAQNVLNVSAHVHDLRDIFVMANTTCTFV